MTERQARFERGRQAFAEGRHSEARALWEPLWHEEAAGEPRKLLQALIQIASALQRLFEQEPRAAEKLLVQALPKLDGLPETYGGVALGRFRSEARALLRAIQDGSDDVRAPALESAGAPFAWRERRPTPPVVAPLERPAHFRKALAVYGEGQFFEAHELWEDLWRDEADPFHKNFLQGLIQVAASMHKLLVQHGTKGAIHLLERALYRLGDVPDGYAGIAVAALLVDVARAKAEIERLAALERTDLDPSFVPRISVL